MSQTTASIIENILIIITFVAMGYCSVILIHTLLWRYRFNKARRERQAHELNIAKDKEQ